MILDSVQAFDLFSSYPLLFFPSPLSFFVSLSLTHSLTHSLFLFRFVFIFISLYARRSLHGTRSQGSTWLCIVEKPRCRWVVAISYCGASAQKLGLHHVAHLDQRPVATKTRPRYENHGN